MTTTVIRREISPVIVERKSTVSEVDRSGKVVLVDRVRDAVVIERRSTSRQVQIQRAPVQVQVAGLQGPIGPQGVPGPSGAGVLAPIDFAFGDASPIVVLTLGEDTEFVLVSLQIEEAFNGTGAQVQLGVVGQPGLLMDTWQNDPSVTEVFETSPRVELPLGTQLQLTITPGAGASTGRGQFVLTSVPIT